jgi:hypothetical protein
MKFAFENMVLLVLIVKLEIDLVQNEGRGKNIQAEKVNSTF